MSRIAHLSDVHLNGTAPRHARFAKALEDAKRRQPDHLVITGDVTARGSPAEHDEFLSALAYWPTPITIVAGNHDGRLQGFTSEMTDLGDSLLVPIDTRARFKPVAFQALGRIGGTQVRALDHLAATAKRPIIAAMHHGPQIHLLHFFDGLVDRHGLRTMLAERPWLHILCGHDHRCLDVGRIHVAPSVAHHTDPVRLYEVSGGQLRSVYRSEYAGAYFT